MSLHAAAQHLAAHGRGKDTQLVHMTPGEVKSLQDLAKAHGGSLTTNPHTGLPEASFLSAALPLAAGVALGPAGFGLSAGTAGLLAGGLGYAMTGSLTKGLMAGLGAYGGAGLGEGLSNLGAVSSEAGLTSGANALGTDVAAFKAAPESFFYKPELTGMATDYTGLPTMEYVADPAKQAAFTDAYAQGMKPSMANMGAGAKELLTNPTADKFKMLGGDQGWMGLAKYGAAALAEPITSSLTPKPLAPLPTTTSMPNPVYTYNRGTATPMPSPDQSGVEQTYFPDAGYVRTAAAGGSISSYAEGGPAIQGMPSHGPVEQMSIANSIGQNTGFPQAAINRGAYATPWQTPISRNMLEGSADTGVNPITGSMNFAQGGLSDLGSYSDGGRLLRGPGDGVSDSIPAVIGKKQPARLADGEFVVPARIVSEIGNGSTEAGARKLYAMMDRVQKARAKTTGKGRVAKNTNAERYLPA